MVARRWLIGGGIAVAAALLVAGALATRDAGTTGPDSADRGETEAAISTSSTETQGGQGSTPQTASVPGSTASPTTASPSNAPGAQGATLADGAKLTTVTVVPESTLAVITGDTASDGDRFAVVFRPYGWGPTRQGGRGLVIRVDSSRRSSANESNLEFDAGQNMLVTVPDVVARGLDGGGSYRGVIVLYANAGALAPYLEEARALR